MRVLAIIPARGGSKGIARKNLVDIAEAPLVVHSIRHARLSRRIDRVLVSTDDEEIRDVALAAGAETPFLRPAELAQDEILDLPVFEHALRHLESHEGYVPDLVVHLRPTAPLRRPHWIDEAIELLETHPDADSVRSVSPPDKHPYRIFRIAPTGYLDPVMKHEHPQPYLLRRQDLPAMYYYNCVIDVTRPRTIFGKGSMTGDRMLPYVMSAEDSFDIDSERDLAVARLFAGRFP
ncbi:MAG: CMP-N,N'-diacetyllegionaminic acid synthase [Gammaproteobacteria bacterium]|nr:CMP-N,N'-diacetyllegionaminic acid synthase [Gammaproteobacteria bacterium]